MDLKNMKNKIVNLTDYKKKSKEDLAKIQYQNMIYAIVEELVRNGIEIDEELQQMKIVPALKVIESMIYEYHGLDHEHHKFLDQFARNFAKRVKKSLN